MPNFPSLEPALKAHEEVQRLTAELASARTLYQTEVDARLVTQADDTRLTDLVTSQRAQLAFREGECTGLRIRLSDAEQARDSALDLWREGQTAAQTHHEDNEALRDRLRATEQACKRREQLIGSLYCTLMDTPDDL